MIWIARAGTTLRQWRDSKSSRKFAHAAIAVTSANLRARLCRSAALRGRTHDSRPHQPSG